MIKRSISTSRVFNFQFKQAEVGAEMCMEFKSSYFNILNF